MIIGIIIISELLSINIFLYWHNHIDIDILVGTYAPIDKEDSIKQLTLDPDGTYVIEYRSPNKTIYTNTWELSDDHITFNDYPESHHYNTSLTINKTITGKILIWYGELGYFVKQ